MTTHLVTGGCGFIGNHLVRALLERGDDVRVLDDLSTGKRANIDGLSVEVLVEDLRDPEVCARACRGVDTIFHQAAVPSVARSVSDPERTFSVNVVGTHTLLLAAREAGVRRMVLASSSSVYGNQPTLPKHEGLPPMPASPYAAQKLSAEMLARSFAASMGIEAVALRYFNVYGPRQDPASLYAAVIPAFAHALLRGESPQIHGDGGQTRDFTFVSDVVAANLAAGTAPAANGNAYNVAGGRRISVLELFDTLRSLTGAEHVQPTHTDPRPGDVRDSLASVEAAQADLGFSPQVPLDEGLRRTVDALRDASPQ